MDKVQFNTEVVNMRKTVKRVKVIIVHSLTRQFKKLQSKKGSEQQVLKNQRRATRYLAEVEAIKDVPLDTVTKKAVTFKKSLQAVLNHPKSSAEERAMARMIHHRLIQERVTKFKEMVTRDLLRTGTKKYRRLRKEKFEAEANKRWKDEEDYQGTLEKMITSEKTSKNDEDIEDGSNKSEDDRWQCFDDFIPREGQHKSPTVNRNEELSILDDDKSTAPSNAVSKEACVLNPKRKGNNKIDSVFLGSLSANEDDDCAIPSDSGKKTEVNSPPPKRAGKIKMDSVFLGRLSDMKDDDITKALLWDRKENLKQKMKRQLEKKQSKKMLGVQRTTDPPKIPMVDQPNPVIQIPGEKLIPGINCHPDLPMTIDAHGNSSRKHMPIRPQSKKDYPSRPRHPTKSPHKTLPAKERLHPSWEASKKRKMESKIVPFQGKKIVFDED